MEIKIPKEDFANSRKFVKRINDSFDLYTGKLPFCNYEVYEIVNFLIDKLTLIEITCKIKSEEMKVRQFISKFKPAVLANNSTESNFEIVKAEKCKSNEGDDILAPDALNIILEYELGFNSVIEIINSLYIIYSPDANIPLYEINENEVDFIKAFLNENNSGQPIEKTVDGQTIPINMPSQFNAIESSATSPKKKEQKGRTIKRRPATSPKAKKKRSPDDTKETSSATPTKVKDPKQQNPIIELGKKFKACPGFESSHIGFLYYRELACRGVTEKHEFRVPYVTFFNMSGKDESHISKETVIENVGPMLFFSPFISTFKLQTVKLVDN